MHRPEGDAPALACPCPLLGLRERLGRSRRRLPCPPVRREPVACPFDGSRNLPVRVIQRGWQRELAGARTRKFTGSVPAGGQAQMWHEGRMPGTRRAGRLAAADTLPTLALRHRDNRSIEYRDFAHASSPFVPSGDVVACNSARMRIGHREAPLSHKIAFYSTHLLRTSA